MKFKNFVSIILPTFGRTMHFRRALDSILRQTYPNFEVIIVDDNYPYSMERCFIEETCNEKKCGNFRIRLIQNPQNLGAQKSRNLGISKARGDFVSFLDDDDAFFPEKIEQQLAFLSGEKVDLVFCQQSYLNDPNHHYSPPDYSNAILRKLILVYNFIGTETFFARKVAIERVGGFDIGLSRFQDWDLAIRLLQSCRFSFQKEILVGIDNGGHKRISNTEEACFSKIFSKHSKISRNLVVLFLQVLFFLKNRDSRRLFLYLHCVWLRKMLPIFSIAADR